MKNKMAGLGKQRVYAAVSLVMVAFFAIGLWNLLGTRAATNTISLQPESGTVTAPAVTVSDTTASGGSAVKFAAGTPPPPPVSSSFSFSAFADVKTGTGTFAQVSRQAFPISGKFTLYPGDVCNSGPDAACFATWKSAYNAGGDFFSKAFVSRGNHDSSSAFWTANFNFAATAARVGATNFTGNNLTYSFDYGNSHVVAVDMPGGDATSMSASTQTWVDNDLKAAEGRGKIHHFVFFHGPPVPQGGHCCTNATAVIQMLGKHRGVVTFNGHEHNLGYTLVDSRFGNSGTPFREFVVGGAGAGLYGCQRGDYCVSKFGFSTIDVSNANVTVKIYTLGTTTPVKTVTFTN